MPVHPVLTVHVSTRAPGGPHRPRRAVLTPRVQREGYPCLTHRPRYVGASWVLVGSRPISSPRLWSRTRARGLLPAWAAHSPRGTPSPSASASNVSTPTSTP